METTSITHHHPLLRLPSDKAHRFSRKLHLGVGDLRVSDRPRRCFGRLTSRFSDSGHQQYYVSSRSNTKKQEKENSSEIKLVKNKLKLIKRLSTDLSSFRETGNNSTDEAKISDAAELLQAQLQQLRLEQKDLKRNMKEEKERNKTTLKQRKCKSDSSSSISSSESSDSDRGEVIDMRRLGSNDFKQSKYIQAQKLVELPTLVGPSSSLIQQDRYEEMLRDERESCGSSNGCSDYPSTSSSISDRPATKRIQICMGGKCKKSGAEDLLEEFQRKVGAEGAVLGCKCMGKCKNGPNLRVSSKSSEAQVTRMQGSGRSSIDSVCIGVGLRDVDVILANILWQRCK